MNAAVVHDAAFQYIIAVRFQYFSHTPAKKVIAQVAEMQGFVGIGIGLFNHDLPAGCRLAAITGILVFLL